MTTINRKGPVINPGLCRCCNAMKKCRLLNVEYEWIGQKEIYSDMFVDTFGLLLSNLDGEPEQRLICATCVSRLRDASAFRRQVLCCEETLLQAQLEPDRDMPIIDIKLEVDVSETKVQSAGVPLADRSLVEDHSAGEDMDAGDDSTNQIVPDDEPPPKMAKKMKKEKLKLKEKIPKKSTRKKIKPKNSMLEDMEDQLDAEEMQQLEAEPNKRLWIHETNKQREELGEYHRLCRELESSEDKFYEYFRMSQASFEGLHELIRPYIRKQNTNFRKAIGSRERLAICMRYIRTGDGFGKISSAFRVGRSSVSKIVVDVSKAITEYLQPTYMPRPTAETWKKSELAYREICDFPNCVGTIDGKHVTVQCPPKSGDDDLIVLLAIADPSYKFTMVDIGSYGSPDDMNIFENSKFYKEFLHDRKNLLPPKPLPGSSELTPHVLIGDEGFALRTYLLRPFPKTAAILDESKKTFNERLYRARRIVEDTFGILTDNWRILCRPIECSVERAALVVKAACCLHNYVRHKHENILNIPESKVQRSRKKKFLGLHPLRPTNQRWSNSAAEVRGNFVAYFNQSSPTPIKDNDTTEGHDQAFSPSIKRENDEGSNQLSFIIEGDNDPTVGKESSFSLTPIKRENYPNEGQDESLSATPIKVEIHPMKLTMNNQPNPNQKGKLPTEGQDESLSATPIKVEIDPIEGHNQ